jgi:hypothetical protein
VNRNEEVSEILHVHMPTNDGSFPKREGEVGLVELSHWDRRTKSSEITVIKVFLIFLPFLRPLEFLKTST